MAIINGRRIQVPPSGITGQHLIQQVNPGPGRRPVIQQGLAFRPIQSGYTYKPTELFDRHGNPEPESNQVATERRYADSERPYD